MRSPLRYFARRLALLGVQLHLNTRVDTERMRSGGYDDVILATGVTPRDPRIEGEDEFHRSGKIAKSCQPFENLGVFEYGEGLGVHAGLI